MTAEVVLPSGVFATVREITVRDSGLYHYAHPTVALAVLASLVTTFDGEKKTIEEVLAMGYAETAPVFQQIVQQLARATKTAGGVA